MTPSGVRTSLCPNEQAGRHCCGALRADKDVAVVLIGEMAYVLKPTVAAVVHGVGFPPRSELVEKVVKANVVVQV